jgi:putative endonuclease
VIKIGRFSPFYFMKYKQVIGEFGERLAINYLRKHGYRILARNLKTSFKEIDIVTQQGKTIIFIEVKTRLSQKFGTADEAISWVKLNNFNRAIELFLVQRNLETDDIRADLISIDINRSKKIAKIKHYKDII